MPNGSICLNGLKVTGPPATRCHRRSDRRRSRAPPRERSPQRRPAAPRCSPGRASRPDRPSGSPLRELRNAARPPASASNCASASGGRSGFGAGGAAHRLAARQAASAVRGEIGPAAATTSSISRRSPLQCRTRSQPAASARRARSAEPAAERPHRQIVGDQNAVEADLAADDLAITRRRQCRRRRRIDRRCRRYARSSPRASRPAPETAQNRCAPARRSRSRPRGQA